MLCPLLRSFNSHLLQMRSRHDAACSEKKAKNKKGLRKFEVLFFSTLPCQGRATGGTGRNSLKAASFRT